MKTEHYLTESEAARYIALSARAQEIRRLIEQMAVEIVVAEIDDENKIGALNWLRRADGVNGLAYALIPQSEWKGGEAWKIRRPDLSGINT